VNFVKIYEWDDWFWTIICLKRGRWFQRDLFINPAPHDLKSQWQAIIFHENASSEQKHLLLNHFEQIC
jgi:hypothetical protein